LIERKREKKRLADPLIDEDRQRAKKRMVKREKKIEVYDAAF
jgi:hypothetical protein